MEYSVLTLAMGVCDCIKKGVDLSNPSEILVRGPYPTLTRVRYTLYTFLLIILLF